MLNITRKTAQKVYIGDDITITVRQIHRGQVSLGIDAPRDIPVHREEIYEKIKYRNMTSELLN